MALTDRLLLLLSLGCEDSRLSGIGPASKICDWNHRPRICVMPAGATPPVFCYYKYVHVSTTLIRVYFLGYRSAERVGLGHR